MKYIISIISIISTLFLFSCDIDKTKDGALPTIDVEVDTKSGSLPEYDIDWVGIDVGTTTKTITVPNVQIVLEEKEIEVPYIDAQWPPEFINVTQQSIAVEAEVIGHEHEIDIDEVYAISDRLIVISSLSKLDNQIGEEVLRVSDMIVINAPDVMVKHYIVGEKPIRGFNNNYTYISSKSKISDKLENAKKIYG